MASKWLRFIFQLPEINGLRIGCPAQSLEAREIPVLEQFEGSPSTGRHVVDLVVEPELGEGCGAVATADDSERLGIGHRSGDGAGACRESRILEHAHWPVPEDRASVHDHVAERRSRTGTDVETLRTFGQAHPEGGEVAASVEADQ